MQLDVATRFLSTLDFEGRADAEWTFQTFPDQKGAQNGGPALTRIFHSPLRRVASVLDKLNALGAGIFACMAVTDGLGRTTENCIAPRAVFLDFDNAEPPSGIGALPPTLVVQSVRGKHIYWALEPDQDFRIWRVVQERLASKFGADRDCHDPPRVMRIPGFEHRKGDPKPVTIELVQEGPRYTLDAIVAAYAISLEPPRRPPPAPTGDHDLDERIKRCEAYMEYVEPAVEGSGGWHHTKNACGTGGDFGLEPGEFWPVLLRWNDRCQPPWDEDALRKKLEAVHARRDKAFGWRLEEPGREGDFSGSRTHSGYTRADEPPHPADGATEPEWLSEAPAPSEEWVPPDEGEIAPASAPTAEPAANAPSVRTPGPVEPTQLSGVVGKARDKPRDKPTKPAAKSKEPDIPPGPPSVGTPPDGMGSIEDIGDGEIDFRVSRMIVYNSDPPSFKLEIDGSKWLSLTTRQLLMRRLFDERFFEIIGRSPTLPSGKGAPTAWRNLVNLWRSAAEVIEQGEEASEFGMLRDELRYVLQGLAISEDGEDIGEKAVRVDESVIAARFITIKNALTAKGVAVTAADLARALRELGVERAKDSERICGARYWRWKISSIRAREKHSSS